jgi:tetratricopeptide (TPR) repeat protein
MQHESAKSGEEQFRKAIELDEGCVAAWVNLGGILLSRWDFQGCVEANRRAIELRPDSVGAHYNAGLGHMYLGQTQAMHDCFARVVELEPDHPAGNYHLAVALLALKRTDEARARLTRAMALGHAPTPELVRELERIDRKKT